MHKAGNFLLLCGIALLASSLYFLWWLKGFSAIRESVQNYPPCPPLVLGCAPPINAASIQVSYSPLVELSSTMPITVKAHNSLFVGYPPCSIEKNSKEGIKYEASLRTSGMELTPAEERESYVAGAALQNTADASWDWAIHPGQLGKYSFTAEVSAIIQDCTLSTLSKTFDIEVVTLYGLSAQQAKLVAMTGGSIGLTFTLSGLITLWVQHRKRIQGLS